MRTFALQLYTVRHALARDPEGTLRGVCEAGYRAVETAPLPPEIPVRRMGELLRSFGLTVTAAHADLPLGECRSEVLHTLAELGATRLIWHGWPRDPECASLEGFRRLADRYTEAAAVAKANGLSFGLHNHWWEYEPLEEVLPYRFLHDTLPPEIFFELDVYWVRTAGKDPVDIVRELGPRITMLHLKDGPAVHGQPMTALGQGEVDIPAILRATDPGVTGVVELDECATDPLEAARESLRFLLAQDD